MIALTRLNGHCITVNSDLIKYAEASPDTTLTLITGEKLIVLESCEEVAELSIAFRAQSLRRAWPDAAASFAASGAFHVSAAHHPHHHHD